MSKSGWGYVGAIVAFMVVQTAVIAGVDYLKFRHEMSAINQRYADDEQQKEDKARVAFMTRLRAFDKLVQTNRLPKPDSDFFGDTLIVYADSSSHVMRPDDGPYNAGVDNPTVSHLAEVKVESDWITGRMSNQPIDCRPDIKRSDDDNVHCRNYQEAADYFLNGVG